jgi:hypothetical protein
MGREGAHETRVRAQSSSTPLCQRLNGIMRRWHGRIQVARNPYRPELHYMRGPGPKWYAKHQGRPETARFEGAAPLARRPASTIACITRLSHPAQNLKIRRLCASASVSFRSNACMHA